MTRLLMHLALVVGLAAVTADATQWPIIGRRIARKGPEQADVRFTTSSPLPNATKDSAYNQSVACTGGTAPYTYAVIFSTLPTGLSINASSGAITGTPTVAGSSTFTAQCTDQAAVSGTKQFTLLVVDTSQPTITDTSPLPSGTAGVSYAYTFTCTGGVGPRTFDLASGSVPGLSLSSAGAYTGTPSTAGTYAVTVRCTDSDSPPKTHSKPFDLTIGASAPTIVNGGGSCGGASQAACILAAGTKGSAYGGVTFTGSGGNTPYTWCLATLLASTESPTSEQADCLPGDDRGGLPPGLTFTDSGDTGVISTGTITQAGTYVFRVKLADGSGAFALKNFSIAVSDPSAAACDGAGADDFFNCVVGLNAKNSLVAKGYKMKSEADLDALNTTTLTRADYLYMPALGGDNYVNAVDAAKIFFRQYNVSLRKPTPRLTLGNRQSGGILVGLDIWWPELFTATQRKHRNGSNDPALVLGGPSSFKGLHLRIGCETASGQQDSRCLEFRPWIAGGNPSAPADISYVLGKRLSSLTRSGSTATATCLDASGCGFSNGDTVAVVGAQQDGTLTSTTCTAGSTTRLTVTGHNVPSGRSVKGRLTLTGSSPAIDKQAILTYVSANELDADVTTTNCGTGGTFTWKAYNGTYVITTSGPSSTTFTFTVPGNPASPASNDISGMWATGPDNTITGTDVASWDVRCYGLLPGCGNTSQNALPGQLTSYAQKPRKWTRHYWYLEINTGSAWTCGGAAGTYDRMWWWMIDQDSRLAQLYSAFEVELSYINTGADKKKCTADDTTNGVHNIYNLDIQMNTSTDQSHYGGLVRDAFFYARHMWYVYHATTTTFTPSASQILVNDGTQQINVLVAPKP